MKTQILTILVGVFFSDAMLAQAPVNIPEKPEMISVEGGSFNISIKVIGQMKSLCQLAAAYPLY